LPPPPRTIFLAPALYHLITRVGWNLVVVRFMHLWAPNVSSLPEIGKVSRHTVPLF